MFNRRTLVSALIVACGSIPASATLLTYTTAASFTAATAGDTFQSVTFPSSISGTSYTDPLTGAVFTDVGTGSMLSGVATPSGWPAGSTLEMSHCTPPGCAATLTITLPSAVTAISMDLGLLNFQGFQITIANTTSGFFTQNTSSPGTNPLFFGATSTSPFTTFTIATEDNVSNLFLDNLEIGTPSGGGGGSDPPDTPEVATLLMIGSGLVMLRCGRRWMPRGK